MTTETTPAATDSEVETLIDLLKRRQATLSVLDHISEQRQVESMLALKAADKTAKQVRAIQAALRELGVSSCHIDTPLPERHRDVFDE